MVQYHILNYQQKKTSKHNMGIKYFILENIIVERKKKTTLCVLN